jgi:serpin B
MTRILGKLMLGVGMFSFIFGRPNGACSAPASSLVEGNTVFALNLYQQLGTRPGNLFFSPYSISTALALTYAGARGNTERQMARVLQFNAEGQRLHASFGELQRHLGEAGAKQGIELSIANALWSQKKHPFLPAFLAIATDEYQANLAQADFATEAGAARDKINRWVAQKTKDKIRDILPAGSLTDLTRLVLVNAIYFKGIWDKPYNKAETSVQPFHISSTREAKAPLMRHFDQVKFLGEGDFQAVELPYKGRELSMVIFLPREIDACGKLESRMTPEFLSSSLNQMKQQKVEIFLPRFELESSFDLNDTLARMGMPDAFGPESDFSGMDGTRQLYLSGVFHKAWGEVNEEGTEAAAATAVVAAARAVVKPAAPPPVFRADHPFIFLIRDMRSGSILFLGRFAGPSD